MKYNVGDFILTHISNSPAIIILVSKDEYNNSFLISINEYGGDYIWIYFNDIIKIANLNSEEKLSIIANFGEWFYEQHKILYQELLIENLMSTFLNDY